jgi:hypothetical protein
MSPGPPFSPVLAGLLPLLAERLLAGPRRGRRCTPASCAGHARRQAFERLSAGWRVPAEPTMLRLNSHFLGF